MQLLSKIILLNFFFLYSFFVFANNENDNNNKKTHLEDIYIWKISDELKLSVNEEKQFTEINKALNKKKSEINKKIQDLIAQMKEDDSEAVLKNYRSLLLEYNQLSISEFDSIKKLLGAKRFVSYLKIKNELNTKLKSILAGEKPAEKKEVGKLPPPKIIIEKNE